MFTSQTSSFQDSIDVEERDDFDSEDIAGFSQKIQLNCYYTIYLYQGTRYSSILLGQVCALQSSAAAMMSVANRNLGVCSVVISIGLIVFKYVFRFTVANSYPACAFF